MNQGNLAIVEIENKIKERREIIDTCEKNIAQLEEKRKEEEATLSKTKLDLDALARTLTILSGVSSNNDNENQSTITPSDMVSSSKVDLTPSSILNLTPGSHTYLAREALLEHKSPMSMPALFAKAQGKKPELKKTSFGANIYRLVAEGKIFKVKDQKVSLLEWAK